MPIRVEAELLSNTNRFRGITAEIDGLAVRLDEYMICNANQD